MSLQNRHGVITWCHSHGPSHFKANPALIGVHFHSREQVVFAYIQNKLWAFSSLISQYEPPLPGGNRYRVQYGSKSWKKKSCWWDTALRLFQLDAVISRPRYRYLISMAGMRREKLRRGMREGLLGIRQKGKQPSKPQQKPQTWPQVKHNSLVTHQAACGVIAPIASDCIMLNSKNTVHKQQVPSENIKVQVV